MLTPNHAWTVTSKCTDFGGIFVYHLLHIYCFVIYVIDKCFDSPVIEWVNICIFDSIYCHRIQASALVGAPGLLVQRNTFGWTVFPEERADYRVMCVACRLGIERVWLVKSGLAGTLHNTGYLADCLRTSVKVRAQFFTWLPSFLFDLMVIQNFNLHCGNK